MFNEANLGIFFPLDTEMVAENDSGGSPLYIGFCKIGDVAKVDKPVWKIIKLEYVNGGTSKKTYASAEMNKVRDDRATYF